MDKYTKVSILLALCIANVKITFAMDEQAGISHIPTVPQAPGKLVPQRQGSDPLLRKYREYLEKQATLINALYEWMDKSDRMGVFVLARYADQLGDDQGRRVINEQKNVLRHIVDQASLYIEALGDPSELTIKNMQEPDTALSTLTHVHNIAGYLDQLPFYEILNKLVTVCADYQKKLDSLKKTYSQLAIALGSRAIHDPLTPTAGSATINALLDKINLDVLYEAPGMPLLFVDSKKTWGFGKGDFPSRSKIYIPIRIQHFAGTENTALSSKTARQKILTRELVTDLPTMLNTLYGHEQKILTQMGLLELDLNELNGLIQRLDHEIRSETRLLTISLERLLSSINDPELRTNLLKIFHNGMIASCDLMSGLAEPLHQVRILVSEANQYINQDKDEMTIWIKEENKRKDLIRDVVSGKIRATSAYAARSRTGVFQKKEKVAELISSYQRLIDTVDRTLNRVQQFSATTLSDVCAKIMHINSDMLTLASQSRQRHDPASLINIMERFITLNGRVLRELISLAISPARHNLRAKNVSEAKKSLEESIVAKRINSLLHIEEVPSEDKLRGGHVAFSLIPHTKQPLIAWLNQNSDIHFRPIYRLTTEDMSVAISTITWHNIQKLTSHFIFDDTFGFHDFLQKVVLPCTRHALVQNWRLLLKTDFFKNIPTINIRPPEWVKPSEGTCQLINESYTTQEDVLQQLFLCTLPGSEQQVLLNFELTDLRSIGTEMVLSTMYPLVTYTNINVHTSKEKYRIDRADVQAGHIKPALINDDFQLLEEFVNTLCQRLYHESRRAIDSFASAFWMEDRSLGGGIELAGEPTGQIRLAKDELERSKLERIARVRIDLLRQILATSVGSPTATTLPHFLANMQLTAKLPLINTQDGEDAQKPGTKGSFLRLMNVFFAAHALNVAPLYQRTDTVPYFGSRVTRANNPCIFSSMLDQLLYSDGAGFEKVLTLWYKSETRNFVKGSIGLKGNVEPLLNFIFLKMIELCIEDTESHFFGDEATQNSLDQRFKLLFYQGDIPIISLLERLGIIDEGELKPQNFAEFKELVRTYWARYEASQKPND